VAHLVRVRDRVRVKGRVRVRARAWVRVRVQVDELRPVAHEDALRAARRDVRGERLGALRVQRRVDLVEDAEGRRGESLLARQLEGHRNEGLLAARELLEAHLVRVRVRVRARVRVRVRLRLRVRVRVRVRGRGRADPNPNLSQLFVDTKFEFGYVRDARGQRKLIYMDEVGT